VDLNTFLLFAFAAFMLNITPGNDMIFVATHAVSRGIRGGVMASIGIFIGCLFHVFLAVFGVSAVIAQSPFLFDLIKYLGATYLIYMGAKNLLSKAQVFDIQQIKTEDSDWKIVKKGVLTNVLNPKVALFFLAFLPQFLPPQYNAVESAIWILALGLWFDVSGTLVNFGVAYAFGKAGNFLQRIPNFPVWQERFTGLVLVGLGLKMAFLKK
jgi:threonine/homoserine/homoserine lactone efflux protein